MVQTLGSNRNYPLPWEHSRTTMFRNAEIVWYYKDITNMENIDLAIALASSGYYDCQSGCTEEVVNKTPSLNQLLDNAPASFEGVVLRFAPGNYYYICSRNNNFTNRSQKGQLTVTSAKK